MSERAAEVYLDAADGLRHVGSAYFHGRGGRLRTSFSYTREWLGQGDRSFVTCGGLVDWRKRWDEPLRPA